MIILTGGAGFVGSNLLKRLNAEGETDILVVDNLKKSDKYRNLVGAKFADYISKADFLDLLQDEAISADVDAIFHQGACTDTLEYDGEYMMQNNYDYSKSLLHFAIDGQIPLIYASTAAVYGHAPIAKEVPENEIPLNIYGYSKLRFDQYVREMMPQAKNTVVGLRYFNVYGNGEQHKGKMSSMVYQFYNQVKSTGVAKLFGGIGKYGAGESTRDFVYVQDLVEMNIHFWKNPGKQAIVNAGTGVSSTWNDLANAVIAEVGSGKIEYIDFPDSLKDKYQFNTTADLTQLRSLGYERKFRSLTEGVHEYLSTIEAELSPFRSSAL
ncbi:ADP-glyceromanno-heptose 6-epimerase [soil metagenome]